jgi:hypothetical protein
MAKKTEQNIEIKMADEAESFEQAAITRELDSWQLVNGHGWQDTKQDAVESQKLWLSVQEEKNG